MNIQCSLIKIIIKQIDLIQDVFLIYCFVILFYNCYGGFRIVLGYLNISFWFYGLQGYNQIVRKIKLIVRFYLFYFVFLRIFYQKYEKGFILFKYNIFEFKFKVNELLFLLFCLYNIKGNGILRSDYVIYIVNLDVCFIVFLQIFLYLFVFFKKRDCIKCMFVLFED